MSDLRRLSENRPVLLSAGARFIRGFKRIGIAFGGAAALIGLGITLFLTLNNYRDLHGGYEQAKCVMRLLDHSSLKYRSWSKTEVDLSGSGCPGPIWSEDLQPLLRRTLSPPGVFDGLEAAFTGIPASIAAGAGIYLLFWVMGWLCAGFTRD